MTIIRKNGMFMLLKLITIIRKTLTILLGTLKDRLWQIQELKNMMVNMSLLISLIITRKKHTRKTLTLHDLITHVIQHIPDKHFKLIRYYGLFANRIRGTLLPIVRKMLNLKEPSTQNNTSYQSMIINEFHVDPLQCPFCKLPMHCACVIFGESTSTILQNHKKTGITSWHSNVNKHRTNPSII